METGYYNVVHAPSLPRTLCRLIWGVQHPGQQAKTRGEPSSAEVNNKVQPLSDSIVYHFQGRQENKGKKSKSGLQHPSKVPL